MGTAALWLALATPAPDIAMLSTATAARLIGLAPALDPFLNAAALRPPVADDPLIAGVALRRPIVVFDMPVRPMTRPGGEPGAMRHSPRLDPIFRDDAPRVFTRLNMPTLDETIPQPARRGGGGGALSGRVVVRLAPDGDRIGMAGGVAGALWKLIPKLD